MASMQVSEPLGGGAAETKWETGNSAPLLTEPFVYHRFFCDSSKYEADDGLTECGDDGVLRRLSSTPRHARDFVDHPDLVTEHILAVPCDRDEGVTETVNPGRDISHRDEGVTETVNPGRDISHPCTSVSLKSHPCTPVSLKKFMNIMLFANRRELNVLAYEGYRVIEDECTHVLRAVGPDPVTTRVFNSLLGYMRKATKDLGFSWKDDDWILNKDFTFSVFVYAVQLAIRDPHPSMSARMKEAFKGLLRTVLHVVIDRFEVLANHFNMVPDQRVSDHIFALKAGEPGMLDEIIHFAKKRVDRHSGGHPFLDKFSTSTEIQECVEVFNELLGTKIMDGHQRLGAVCGWALRVPQSTSSKTKAVIDRESQLASDRVIEICKTLDAETFCEVMSD